MSDHKTSTSHVKTVLVLGGNGFIGSHIVKQLRGTQARVLIGTSTRRTAQETPNARFVQLQKMNSQQDWLVALSGVDVVVNAVGILRERPFERYEQLHHHAVAALAKACAVDKIRLIHVSILGVKSAAKSRFVASKLRGEEAVRRSDADWYIVRPSLVDGEGGHGASWFRRVARWPVHFSPANAVGRFAAIDADDVGEAIAVLALGAAHENKGNNRVFELGGDRVLTVFEYLALLDPGDRRATKIVVPGWFAKLVSHICDLFHLTPFSFGHYELLQYRNYPERNRLAELLGRPATRIPGSRGSEMVTRAQASNGRYTSSD
jgi:uncharacterized protein YbjT (DUF2867 family)